jgi:hypothetical protein
VRKTTIAALLLFFILSLIFTYPLPLHLAGAVEDTQDALLNVWITAWDGHQLLNDPFHLFDANIFYPYPRTLAYSELLLGNALLALPLTAVTGNPILGYNVALLLSFLLSGLGAYLLVLKLTRSSAAGLLAGAIFSFPPTIAPRKLPPGRNHHAGQRLAPTNQPASWHQAFGELEGSWNRPSTPATFPFLQGRV